MTQPTSEQIDIEWVKRNYPVEEHTFLHEYIQSLLAEIAIDWMKRFTE